MTENNSRQSQGLGLWVTYKKECLYRFGSPNKPWISRRPKNIFVNGLFLASLGLLLSMIAACGGDDPTAVPQSTVGSPTQVPTATGAPSNSGPTVSLGSTFSPDPTKVLESTANTVGEIKMSAQGSLGGRLTDSDGMTLYTYTKDELNVSNCSDNCAAEWPPFLVDDYPFASRGINADWLTTIERGNGSLQAAYNGMPLYRFAGDEKPGDVNGQGQDGIWFAISSKGHALYNSVAVNAAGRWVSSGLGSGNDSQHGEFSTILVDQTGRSLYLFEDDTPMVSNCAGDCAIAWPPLITIEDPTPGDGIAASRIGTAIREDGTAQVTFDGSPLYYYSNDQKRGDSFGQDVNNAWYVINNAEPLTIILEEQNASGQTGIVVLTGRANFTNISLQLSKGTLETELAHIHEGQCEPGKLGEAVYALTSLDGGSGTSETNVPVSFDSLIPGGFAVDTHKAGEASIYTSCGNIKAN